VFLAVLSFLGVSVALWTAQRLGAERFDPVAAAWLSAAFFAARLLTMRLPQGDEVYVTLMVGLCGIALLGIGEVLVASAVAGLFESISRFSQSQRSVAVARALDAVRATAVVGLMAPWQLVLHPLIRGGQTSDIVIWWVSLAGLTYAVLDVLTVAVQQRLTGGASPLKGVAMLLRPLGFVYLVHVAMAAVVVRLYAIPGLWAFPIALLLMLILQNSFNMYLRIRRAYTETIGALAHAAELDRPHYAGHSRRVADLSVAVGRRMGLSGHDLEQIGYAAALHDIGRIGHGDYEQDSVHTKRGAEIVASIPFLAGVAPLIDWREQTDSADQPIGAAIVKTCSRYDRLRAEVGAHLALDTLMGEDRGADNRVLSILEEVVRGQFSKSRRVL
jgi:hypothetical protein